MLLHFAYPLPINTIGPLMAAVGRAAERLGYTQLHLITAGPYTGAVAGTPPPGGVPSEPPEDPSRSTPT